MPTCSAFGCTSSTRHKNNRENGIFFHDFPKREKSPERFQKWVEYCNRKDFDPGNNRKSACLCSRHFDVADLDESQLMKIKMMPTANLRGPRLKPGTVPSVVCESLTDLRKSTKVPQNPTFVKSKKPKPVTIPEIDWDELTSKKRRFTTSLMKWRDCLIKEEKAEQQKRLSLPVTTTEREDIKKTKSKSTQCELGLEMHRYVNTSSNKKPLISYIDNNERIDDIFTGSTSDKKAPLKSLEDNGVREDDRKCKSETFSDDSSGVSDNENETVFDESNFAAWGSLLLLFKICNICSQEVTNIHHGMKGNKIYVKSVCTCGNKVTWTSRPS